MKHFSFVSIILFAITLNSQVIVENNKIGLEFLKAKKLSALQGHTLIKIKSREIKTVMVKIKMNTLTDVKELIDINKFYLIDDKTKSKIKLIDASFLEVTQYFNFTKLVDEKYASLAKKHSYFSFDSSVRDTFYDYDIDGYNNIVFPINFGTKRKPKECIIYYKPKKFKKKKLILFFPFLKSSKNTTLYYGNEEIQNFDL